jgi:hypothetical protein
MIYSDNVRIAVTFLKGEGKPTLYELDRRKKMLMTIAGTEGRKRRVDEKNLVVYEMEAKELEYQIS